MYKYKPVDETSVSSSDSSISDSVRDEAEDEDNFISSSCSSSEASVVSRDIGVLFFVCGVCSRFLAVSGSFVSGSFVSGSFVLVPLIFYGGGISGC